MHIKSGRKCPIQPKKETKNGSWNECSENTERAVIIEKNPEALLQRVRLIKNAKKEIILSTFAFQSDESGKLILGALHDAADRGVHIRLLVDGMESWIDMEGNPYFYGLSSHENVEIKLYNKANPLKPWKMMGRMHEYLCLAGFLIFNTLIAGLITSFINAKLLEPITRLSKAMKEVSRGDFEQHLETNSSHEFKTPINAIEGYTMLLQGEELSQEQEEYVEKILFNTQRLSGLVGNILLLSKLENQNIPMKKTEYRLDEQIRQAFLSLETKWTEKEIGFQVELEEVKYTGNEGLFMHIWMNLLDNAIKFSPAKGTITMFLKQEQDSVKFILEDEGPGIEDDVKSRIFDKFYQVDGSHKAEGNGLGLALVKRIVDSAGGTIKAENREYGGCRFVVELPIQKDEAI